jgi:hypothetical protein
MRLCSAGPITLLPSRLQSSTPQRAGANTPPSAHAPAGQHADRCRRFTYRPRPPRGGRGVEAKNGGAPTLPAPIRAKSRNWSPSASSTGHETATHLVTKRPAAQMGVCLCESADVVSDPARQSCRDVYYLNHPPTILGCACECLSANGGAATSLGCLTLMNVSETVLRCEDGTGFTRRRAHDGPGHIVFIGGARTARAGSTP